jgi:hypothetical protein
MIFSILKNTFPALSIVWTVFLTEYFRTAILYRKENGMFFLKLFFFYTLIGLIIGGLSAGILAKKQKKYSYTFENDVKKYSVYFLKNIAISFLALFSLTSREIINNPLLYNSTLLNGSFWFSGFFMFIRDKFSPLYFTIFFVIIIIMSVHNLIKTLSLYHGKQRAAGYITALILSALLIFNYGYLNAAGKKDIKNIVMIGAENLERQHMSGSNIKDRPYLKKLKQHCYDFRNCFTPVLDPDAVLLSVITSSSPEKNMFGDGIIRQYPESKTLFDNFGDSLYNAVNLSDLKFRYERRRKSGGDLPVCPSVTEQRRSEILEGFIFAPVIFNNGTGLQIYPEVLLMNGYRERTLLKKQISDIVQAGNKKFIMLYTIPEYKDKLPYPYYRSSESGVAGSYLNYLDDEIGMVYQEIEKNGKADDTVICLFGIPSAKEGLKAKDYRIPFFLSSSEYSIERKVKNPYTTMDILPTVLEAAGVKIKYQDFEGRSFFDPEFIHREVVLTDIYKLKSASDPVFSDTFGSKSKNLHVQAEIFPLLPRSIISAEMKLDAVPGTDGMHYKLFDIEKDPDETTDLYFTNASTGKRLKEALELKIRKDLGAKVIGGHFFK